MFLNFHEATSCMFFSSWYYLDLKALRCVEHLEGVAFELHHH